MAILYVMVGTPGSGKSTWAKRFVADTHCAYVSRDAVRFDIIESHDYYFSKEDVVYGKFVDLIAEQLRAGCSVIADATHLSHNSRFKLVRNIAKRGLSLKDYEIIFVVMDTPVGTCLARNELRQARERVPDSAIHSMANSLTIPHIGEFENVKEVWLIRG